MEGSARSLFQAVRSTWQSEVLMSHGGECLQPFRRSRTRLEPLQALRGVECQVDQHTISASLNFEMLEEHVGLEVAEGLVDDIFRLWGAGRHMCTGKWERRRGQRWGDRGLIHAGVTVV